MITNLKRINLLLLSAVLTLFGYYIYQTVSISSGNVGLVNLKKEFLEKKNNLNGFTSRADNPENFEPDLIKEALKMAEIERFDYIIIGPSEFVLIQKNSNNTQ